MNYMVISLVSNDNCGVMICGEKYAAKGCAMRSLRINTPPRTERIVLERADLIVFVSLIALLAAKSGGGEGRMSFIVYATNLCVINLL